MSPREGRRSQGVEDTKSYLKAAVWLYVVNAWFRGL
jgi:hypothetical protein